MIFNLIYLHKRTNKNFRCNAVLGMLWNVCGAYIRVVQNAEKAIAQIGTFGFCRPTRQTQKTKGAYFFAHARTD